MRKQSSILLVLFISSSLSHYNVYKGSTFNKNYAIKTIPSNSGSLSSKILPKVQNPFINTGGSSTTTTTTTQIQLPSYTAVQPVQPEPVVIPVSYHAPVPVPVHVHAPAPVAPHHHHHHHHGSSNNSESIPHMHSGHPYIAPAVAPNNMTHQQLIEYLASNKGDSFQHSVLEKSGNVLAKCNSYCNTLPESPVCDSANVLYRNECAAKCIKKTVSKENLRYGMCCCDKEEFEFGSLMKKFKKNKNRLCLSTCIYNCLGEDVEIEDEHTDINLKFGTDGKCPKVN